MRILRQGSVNADDRGCFAARVQVKVLLCVAGDVHRAADCDGTVTADLHTAFVADDRTAEQIHDAVVVCIHTGARAGERAAVHGERAALTFIAEDLQNVITASVSLNLTAALAVTQGQRLRSRDGKQGGYWGSSRRG